MRKALVAACIFLFFLLIVAAILFKILYPSSATSNNQQVSFPTEGTSAALGTAPDQFVESFYDSYLDSCSKDPYFPNPETRDEVLAPYVSSRFLGNWDQTVSQIEVNPILLTADDPTSWGSSLTANTLSVNDTSSTVHLVIGSGANSHAYTVSLVKDPAGGSWKIDGVASSL